jgi:uroporphyrinogen-III decarboxylase
MTGRERFLKVFRGESPDRVPITLFIADQGHFLNQMYPDVDPQDFDTLQLKVVELQKQLGVDLFVRLLYGINDPLNIIYGGLDVSQQTDTWEVSMEKVQKGNTLIERATIKTPDGTLTQDFSINEIRPGTFMYACTKLPIEGPEDLDMAIKYEPKIPDWWAGKAKERVQKIKKAVGDDGIVGTWSPHGPFNNCSLLIKLDVLYSIFLVDYDYYKKLITFAYERSLPYVKALDNAGVDVHCVGGNVPGGFLGKNAYDNYILPFEKEYIDFVQKGGTPAMYHNCGDVMNLVESYIDLGVRIVEPFAPSPLGDAVLSEAKEKSAGNYVMLSGIDQVNVLQNGTKDDVMRSTEEVMKTGKPGGKFIMQPVDFLEYGTPVQNVEAYVETALEFASY